MGKNVLNQAPLFELETEDELMSGGSEYWQPLLASLPDAKLTYVTSFFTKTEGETYLRGLLENSDWEQPVFNFSGRKVLAPRLIKWYADEDKEYAYSSISHKSHSWTPLLLDIKARVEQTIPGVTFNSVLINYYRDGNDSVAWHSDDEREFGTNPTIASVTFGSTRSFQLKHKIRSDLPLIKLPLFHGSLLLMSGPTQTFWKHRIPKTVSTVGPRINLTFRHIY